MSDRVIPFRELLKKEYADYADHARLSYIFNHAVVQNDNGVLRWKENGLVRVLFDDGPFFTPPSTVEPYSRDSVMHRGTVDLNMLWIDLQRSRFSMLEMVKFYMDMGYSLDGFSDVFGQQEASTYFADADDEEDVIEYLVRKYRGKRLKI